MYMMQPEDFTISDQDERYLEDLTAVFHVMSQVMSDKKVVNILRKSIFKRRNLSLATVYRMITDTRDLFGNVVKRNREFDKTVIRDKYIALHDKLIRISMACQNDPKASIKAIEQARLTLSNIVRLDGLDQQAAEGLTPDQLSLPTLIITSDPAALINGNIEEAEVEDSEE